MSLSDHQSWHQRAWNLAHVDLTIVATQAGQSSAGIPESGCWNRRREEAESFSKKLVKVTSVAWQLHATLHTTVHATLPNCWQRQHFGDLRLLNNEVRIQVGFSVLT